MITKKDIEFRTYEDPEARSFTIEAYLVLSATQRISCQDHQPGKSPPLEEIKAALTAAIQNQVVREGRELSAVLQP